MIYVIGSISAGKSTFSKMLADDLGSDFYLEDIENGLIKNMLKEFYSAGKESRSRVAAMLQVGFLTVRYRQLKEAMVKRNAVMDSNLISDGIMANLIHDRGEMDNASFNIYMTLNQEMQGNVNGMPWNGFPDLIVYLDIDPEHEIESIQSRGREMEDIRKDPELVNYYHSVNKAYKDWYEGFHQATVVKVDREKYDFVANDNDRNAVLDMVEQKLVELGCLTQNEFNAIRAKREGVKNVF